MSRPCTELVEKGYIKSLTFEYRSERKVLHFRGKGRFFFFEKLRRARLVPVTQAYRTISVLWSLDNNIYSQTNWRFLAVKTLQSPLVYMEYSHLSASTHQLLAEQE